MSIGASIVHYSGLLNVMSLASGVLCADPEPLGGSLRKKLPTGSTVLHII